MLEKQITQLFSTIQTRRSADPDLSWTAKLLQGGTTAIGKKLAEECTELILAAREYELDISCNCAQKKKQNSSYQAKVVCEAADVLYHYLVLLAHLGLSVDDVAKQLSKRSARSGIEEKNSR